MNLALSNFAWDNNESNVVFDVMKKNDFNNIEIILTKLSDWSDINDKKIVDFKKYLDNNEIIPYSIQSLFYNVNCDSLTDYERVIQHVSKIIHYSKLLDVNILVLGSPKLRRKTEFLLFELSKTFKKIDELLDNSNIKMIIEPNSRTYGGDYFFTIDEIVNFISSNNFKNIKTMIDTHNSLIEKQNPIIDVVKYIDYIHHIHVSEMNLIPIEVSEFHIQFSKKLKEINYDKMITYEVLKSKNTISSINTFSKLYQ